MEVVLLGEGNGVLMSDENGSSQKGSSSPYGLGPVFAGVGMTGVLLLGAVFGGVGMAKNMSSADDATVISEGQNSPSADPSASGEPGSSAGQSNGEFDPSEGSQDPEDGNNGSAEGTDPKGPDHDSTTTPDRDSDQASKTSKVIVYQVVSGDTLTSISSEFGVGVDRIAEYNKIRDVNVIYAGSALQLPILVIPTDDKK